MRGVYGMMVVVVVGGVGGVVETEYCKGLRGVGRIFGEIG